MKICPSNSVESSGSLLAEARYPELSTARQSSFHFDRASSVEIEKLASLARYHVRYLVLAASDGWNTLDRVIQRQSLTELALSRTEELTGNPVDS